MSNVPRKVGERLSAGLKRFQPILISARDRDINESDTVVLVTDILADVFGFDKYAEVTSEHMIRSTFCDLAIKLDGKLQFLIEVKAIGLELKDSHIKQAVDYAANQGVDWVALTNGIQWRVFRVIFNKPINQEVVLDFDFLSLNPRTSSDLECLYPITREGIYKAALAAYQVQKQATSNVFIAAVILSDPVVEMIRRELRRLSPDARLDLDGIRDILMHDVLKREAVEGQRAEDARRKVQRAASKALRSVKAKEAPTEPTSKQE